MVPSQDLYQFSSHVPKVKKSIKKYKKKYNQDFLKFLNETPNLDISPPKFLQPIKFYRFYCDLIAVDNPRNFSEEECIYPLKFYLNYKSISQILIGNTLKIDLQEMFSSEWSSIDLFADRLDTLGDEDAHDLSKMLYLFKDKHKIKEISKETVDASQVIRFDSSVRSCLNAKEWREYEAFQSENQKFMSQNEENFVWKMKKVLYKNKTYSRFGYILRELEFNKKCVKLFSNQDLDCITCDNVEELLQLTSISKPVYFKFFMGILNLLINPPKEEVEVGLRTLENFYIPCSEKFKVFMFKSKNYEEMNVYVTYVIDGVHLRNLEALRATNKIEEEAKCNLKKAQIKAKYQKIKNVYCESFKKLCVLYYAKTMKKMKMNC